MRHGKGIFQFKNGARYEGTWKNGLKHGTGKFNYPDGSWYWGCWKENKKRGFGKYCYANGDVYEGTWKDDLKHGVGTYKYQEAEISIRAVWEKGSPKGPVEIFYPNFRYHGYINKNQPIGEGVFSFGAKYMQPGHVETFPNLEPFEAFRIQSIVASHEDLMKKFKSEIDDEAEFDEPERDSRASGKKSSADMRNSVSQKLSAVKESSIMNKSSVLKDSSFGKKSNLDTKSSGDNKTSTFKRTSEDQRASNASNASNQASVDKTLSAENAVETLVCLPRFVVHGIELYDETKLPSQVMTLQSSSSCVSFCSENSKNGSSELLSRSNTSIMTHNRSTIKNEISESMKGLAGSMQKSEGESLSHVSRGQSRSGQGSLDQSQTDQRKSELSQGNQGTFESGQQPSKRFSEDDHEKFSKALSCFGTRFDDDETDETEKKSQKSKSSVRIVESP